MRLTDSSAADHNVSILTDWLYWLMVARHPRTGEIKYLVSNAPVSAGLQRLLAVAFARWHIEKWFERAKQEAGVIGRSKPARCGHFKTDHS